MAQFSSVQVFVGDFISITCLFVYMYLVFVAHFKCTLPYTKNRSNISISSLRYSRYQTSSNSTSFAHERGQSHPVLGPRSDIFKQISLQVQVHMYNKALCKCGSEKVCFCSVVLSLIPSLHSFIQYNVVFPFQWTLFR